MRQTATTLFLFLANGNNPRARQRRLLAQKSVGNFFAYGLNGPVRERWSVLIAEMRDSGNFCGLLCSLQVPQSTHARTRLPCSQNAPVFMRGKKAHVFKNFTPSLWCVFSLHARQKVPNDRDENDFDESVPAREEDLEGRAGKSSLASLASQAQA